MKIHIDDLTGTEIAKFLEDHVAEMRSVSPPESKHALDLKSLRQPEITFWTMWDEAHLVGCGAIKHLDDNHAEIKSMRLIKALRGKGLASTLLQHIIDFSRDRGYLHLSLETGSMEFFEPARKLYEKFGFNYCEPFAEYKLDPNSVFMSLSIPSVQ
ncbi:MAG: GNAT family N-acetyltransferase [Gammaproteobacteria bacterium]|nr:GNAT family N-acetyltransferase [Gammaproteobacteria bacterium]